MAKSDTALNDAIKAKYLPIITEMLNTRGEEVLRTGSGEVAIPVVDEEGNEKFLVFNLKVPKGSRDGEPYDGYGMAEEYRMNCEKKARKAAEAAEAKKKKIERDNEYRAKQKANKEKNSGG